MNLCHKILVLFGCSVFGGGCVLVILFILHSPFPY